MNNRHTSYFLYACSLIAFGCAQDTVPAAAGFADGGTSAGGATGAGGVTGAGGSGGGQSAAGGAAGQGGMAGSGGSGGQMQGMGGGGGSGQGGAGGEDACVTAADVFENELWDTVFQSRCVACHTDAGIASQSLLVLSTPDEPDWVATNLEQLQRVVDATEEGIPLLLLKPTGRVPHTGGSLIDPDEEAYRHLEGLVGRLNGTLDECGQGDTPVIPPSDACEELEAGRRLLRRLSHTCLLYTSPSPRD